MFPFQKKGKSSKGGFAASVEALERLTTTGLKLGLTIAFLAIVIFARDGIDGQFFKEMMSTIAWLIVFAITMLSIVLVTIARHMSKAASESAAYAFMIKKQDEKAQTPQIFVLGQNGQMMAMGQEQQGALGTMPAMPQIRVIDAKVSSQKENAFIF
jgi:hypothetical protein